MAFDFPSNPTPGQTFFDPASGARYTYTNGTWLQVASSPVLKGTTGDAPPSSPDPGQLWWESDTGRMFIYYTDVNSSQWVQISGPLQQSVGLAKILEYEAPADFTQYDFPLPASGYHSLEVHISRGDVSVAASPVLRLSWDGGVTFEAGATSYVTPRMWCEGTTVAADNTNAASIPLGASWGVGVNVQNEFRMWMPLPASNKRWAGDWRADIYASTSLYRVIHGRTIESAHFGPPNYMRLLVSGASLKAGLKIQLYGYQ